MPVIALIKHDLTLLTFCKFENKKMKTETQENTRSYTSNPGKHRNRNRFFTIIVSKISLSILEKLIF